MGSKTMVFVQKKNCKNHILSTPGWVHICMYTHTLLHRRAGSAVILVCSAVQETAPALLRNAAGYHLYAQAGSPISCIMTPCSTAGWRGLPESKNLTSGGYARLILARCTSSPAHMLRTTKAVLGTVLMVPVRQPPKHPPELQAILSYGRGHGMQREPRLPNEAS